MTNSQPKLTVADLIVLLRQHDPAALVVLRHDYDDPGGFVTCQGLRLGNIQAVKLQALQSNESWFDPIGGAQLYRLCVEGGQDLAGADNGVLLE